MPAPFRDSHDPNVRLARTEKAVEKLKRRVSNPQGISFDLEPQDGGFLYTKTSGVTLTSDGWGTQLEDDSTGGILLHSTSRVHLVADSDLSLATTAGDISVDVVGGDLAVTSDGGIGMNAVDAVALESSLGNVSLVAAAGDAGLGGVVTGVTGTLSLDLTGGLVGSDFQTTITMATETFGIRARKGAVGVTSNLYNITAATGGAQWEHVWYAADGTGPVMSITWNGVAWDYKIRGGSTWSSSL